MMTLKNNLKKKFIVFTSIVLSFFVFQYIGMSFVLTENTKEFKENQAKIKIEQINQIISSELVRLQAVIDRLSISTYFYKILESNNTLERVEKLAKVPLIEKLMETNDINFLLFDNNTYLVRNNRTQKIPVFPEQVKRFITSDNDFLIFFRQPIVQTDGAGPPHGNLIVAKYLDENKLSNILKTKTTLHHYKKVCENTVNVLCEHLLESGFDINIRDDHSEIHVLISDEIVLKTSIKNDKLEISNNILNYLFLSYGILFIALLIFFYFLRKTFIDFNIDAQLPEYFDELKYLNTDDDLKVLIDYIKTKAKMKVKYLPTIFLVFMLACSSAFAFTDHNEEQRMKIGLKLFSVFLSADQNLVNKKNEGGKLVISVYYHNREDLAEMAKEYLESLGTINNIPIVVTINNKNTQFRNNTSGIFLVQKLPSIKEISIFARENKTILFSPFDDDVENGATVGILIEDKVLPIINKSIIDSDSIKFKPFFLKNAKII